ncbi:MAG: hypothetical protein ACRC2R_07890 [Xenococcaceae cyanobacterium]
MEYKTLKRELNDWVEIDTAIHILGYCCGFIQEGERFPKYVYWSINPIGDLISDTLFRMVDLGILERRDDRNDIELRWNPSFKTDWE